MTWYAKEFLILAIPLLLVAIYKFFIFSRIKKGAVKYPLTFIVIDVKKSLRQKFNFLPDLFRFCVLILLLLALLQPRLGIEAEEIERQGIDIMIVLDVSGSMAAEDFKPNRMEAAKTVTEKFIMDLQDHRVGLVVFSGLAVTQCPLTMDYGTLVELLRRSNFGMLKRDGTAIGDGLISAVNGLVLDRENQEERDKVIILLTDGENNAGVVEPLDAAKIAAQQNIKIYAVGIGTPEGAPVPITRGGRTTYARNRDGSLYLATFDEQLLKDMAFLTDGKYFRVTDSETLQSIYEQIAQLETSTVEVVKTVRYAERFYWFLAPAFALLAIEIFLRAKVFQRIF